VQVKRQQRAPSRFLALAGTGRSGLGDVSTNVKQYVAEALAQKYPQRTGSQKTGAQHSGVQAVVARPVAKQRKAGIA
jgi:predicted chitinase